MTTKNPDGPVARALQPLVEQLRRLALSYPETHEDHPWGHSAFKVKGMVFLFVGADDDGLGVSVKLPTSRYAALALPFCEPTHYGLGKHGWVSASFPPDQVPPLELLSGWIDESFRAIAPKKLVAQLPPAGAPATLRVVARPAARAGAKATKQEATRKKATPKAKATARKAAGGKKATGKKAARKAPRRA